MSERNDRAARPAGADGAQGNPGRESKQERGLSAFVTRTWAGLVYAGLFIVCLLLGELPCALYVCVLSVMCCFEFFRMMRRAGKMPNVYLGLVAAGLFPLCALINSVWLMGLLLLLILSVGLWYVGSPRTRIEDVSITIFGPLYTGLMLSGIVLVRGVYEGFAGGLLGVGVCGSIWVSDSFAYLVGSRFGKHKMAPRISPHKTWEGFAAGLAGSSLIWLILWLVGYYDLTLWYAIFCGAIVDIMGVFGDLLESRIKRGVGVKDSGTIMPGHGGMLDRCDSLIFAGVVARILLYIWVVW